MQVAAEQHVYEREPVAPRRIPQADLARVVGAVAVIALHVSGYLFGAKAVLPERVWFAGLAFQSFFRFAVPLFVMVSGALLLEPKRQTVSEFYRRRLSRILVPLVFWTVFYTLFSIYFRHDQPASLVVFFDQLARGRSYNHLYFLWLILGLYVLTPYLRVWVAALDRRQLIQLTLTILVGTALDQFLRQWFAIDYSPTAVSWCAQFLGYFLLGYVLRSVRVNGRLMLVSACFVASTAATAYLWWLFPLVLRRATGWPGSTFSPLVMIASAAAFLVVSEIGRTMTRGKHATKRWLEVSSELSFGVYLVHPIFVAILYKVLPATDAAVSPFVWCAFWTAAIALVSFGAVSAIGRVPYLRQIVGLASTSKLGDDWSLLPTTAANSENRPVGRGTWRSGTSRPRGSATRPGTNADEVERPAR